MQIKVSGQVFILIALSFLNFISFVRTDIKYTIVSVFIMNAVKTFFKEALDEILESILPNRTKRLITIGSLCTKVIEKEELTEEYLALLNNQLSLCREEAAFKLPMVMADKIWNNLEIDPIKTEIMMSSEIKPTANRILANLPEWLKYDSDEVMIQELSSLLRFNSIYHRTHQQALH